MNLASQKNSACPVCSQTEALPLCESNGYTVLRCSTCACDFVWPMPDNKELKAYYDNESYFHSDEAGSYTDYDLNTESVIPLFCDFLKTIPHTESKKILDIGCAFGTHLAEAAQMGWESWGVEVSDYAREIALTRHGEKIHVVESIEKLPKLEFDVIIMLDVLEHLPNPYEFFLGMFFNGLIGKNTQFLITTPNARSADAVIDPATWIYRHPPSHLVYFSANTLNIFFSNFEAEDISIEGIYPTQLKDTPAYLDEKEPYNHNLINYAGLFCVAKGFDRSFRKLRFLFNEILKSTKNFDTEKFYKEIFWVQKEVIQKHTLKEQSIKVELQHSKNEEQRLIGIIDNKSQDIARLNQELLVIKDELAKKSLIINRNNQDINSLNSRVKAKDTQITQKNKALQRLYQSKWFRLGNALKMPSTPKNIARVAYLIIGLIAPKKVNDKFEQIISRFRVKDEGLANDSSEKNKDSNVNTNEIPRELLHKDCPYTVEVMALGVKSKTLLVAHEFSRTGAPNAVMYLAQALYSINGTKPAVISPVDGPLREEFEREGFPTIVDPLLFAYQGYSLDPSNFVASFQNVIVTSLASFGFIRCFWGVSKHLTWWIHETDEGFNAVARMAADLPLLFAASESIWLGSPLCFSIALQYATQEKLHLMLYGCADISIPHRQHSSKKIVFSIIGSVVSRKGQDIFLAAIEQLPENLKNKAVFRVIGSPLPFEASLAYYKKVYDKLALMPQVEYIESMSADKLCEFYAETDVFVSASRDDPMPIVITQGLMFSKVCLCSSAIGHARLLEDGKDGLIFTSESAEELSKKMAWLIQNPTQLAILGKSGRRVYEDYFLMSSFVNNVRNLISDYQ